MNPKPAGRLSLPFLLLGLALVPAASPAEDLRTLVAQALTLPTDPQGILIDIAYNEAFAVSLPKDALFIQGLEVEIKSPAAALAFPGSIAWELWKRVDPLPEKTRYAYAGDRLLSQVLPNRTLFAFQVPLRGDHNLKSGAFSTVLPTVLEAKDFPVLFRLLPIAKGVPPDLERADFQVRLRPLFTDEGALKIVLRYPEGLERGDLAILIDGKAVEGRELFVLKPGPHYLRLSSEAYREENRSFTIEQGKTLEFDIDLEDTTPVLLIEAPDSALVLLDGQKLNHAAKPSMTLEPGEHTLLCRIGDYSLTRKFSAFRGKTYKVVLSVNLDIQEAP